MFGWEDGEDDRGGYLQVNVDRNDDKLETESIGKNSFIHEQQCQQKWLFILNAILRQTTNYLDKSQGEEEIPVNSILADMFMVVDRFQGNDPRQPQNQERPCASHSL